MRHGMELWTDVEKPVSGKTDILSVGHQQHGEVIVTQNCHLVGAIIVQKQTFLSLRMQVAHQLMAGPNKHLEICIHIEVFHEIVQEAKDDRHMPAFPHIVNKFSTLELQLCL